MAGPVDTPNDFTPANLIIEHTTDMWLVVDPDWRITYLNHAAEQFTRHKRDQAVGQNLWNELPAQWDTAVVACHERAMRTRQPQEVIGYQQEAGRWYRFCLVPLSEQDDSLAVGITDVTTKVLEDKQREQKVHESEERLRLATEAAEVGIWDYSLADQHLILSPLCFRLLGLAPQESILGHDVVKERIHPDDLERVTAAVQETIERGRDLNLEYRVVWPDASVHWLTSRGTRVLNDQGQPVRFYGTAIDTTQRKRAEDELVRQAEQLVRSNADLQQFAYVTSHDLQEPLRGIASFAQLLGQRYRGKLDPDADEFISYIINGVRRMSSLIDDLLIYSRVVNLERTPSVQVDMNGVVQWAKMNLQQALAETRGHVSQEDLPTLRGDQVQFVQLMQNLLSNAIKYHRRGVPPHIRITVQRQNDEWLFGVRDNGIGIEPQFQNRIFGLFKRLHGRDIPGTGIGLAICRKIVEQYGGRMWVESQPGQGSTFFFTLPA